MKTLIHFDELALLDEYLPKSSQRNFWVLAELPENSRTMQRTCQRRLRRERASATTWSNARPIAQVARRTLN